MAGMLEWLLQSGLGGAPPAALMSGAEPNAAWTGGPAPSQRGLPKDTENPLAGLLASMFQRPTGPGFFGEQPGVPSDSIWRQGAAPAAAATPSGAEPSDVWGPSKPSTNDPFAGEPTPIAAADVPLPRPRPNGIGAIDDSAPAPLSLAPSRYDDGMSANAQATDRPIAPKDLPMPGTEKSLLDRVFNPNNAGTLLALGSGFSGAGSIGTGMKRAFAAAGPAVAMDRAFGQKQQTIADTYRALVAKGVPPAEALAASQNPEIMKAVAGKYFETKPRQHVTLTDMAGGQRIVTVDPNNGKVYEADGTEVKSGSGSGDAYGDLRNLQPAYNENGRDEAFMKALKAKDPIIASEVEALLEGRASAAGRNLQRLLPLAARAEKDFTQQDYTVRQNLEKSYRGGGEGFKQLRAANTAITHGAQLFKAIDGLKNWDTLPAANKYTGAIAKQYNKEYQDARKTFEANAEPFARELDFALTGKSTVSGQNEIRKLFDVDASGVENRAALTRVLDLLKGRIDEHEHAYSAGRKSAKLPLEALSEKNRGMLDEIISGKRGAAAPAPNPPAAAASAVPVGNPSRTSTGINWSIQP